MGIAADIGTASSSCDLKSAFAGSLIRFVSIAYSNEIDFTLYLCGREGPVC